MDAKRRAPADIEIVHDRQTVVTALPLRRAAQRRLAELLHARIVDIRDPVDHADLVLTPACSPQLIGLLKRKYEGARIVVVELDDWDLDIDLPGPVKRVLRSGADAYVLADSLEELANKLASRDGDPAPSTATTELPAPSTVDELVAVFLSAPLDESRVRRSGE